MNTWIQAWEATLCKKPLHRVIDGKAFTFSCLLVRGHEGKCCEAVVQYKDGGGPADAKVPKKLSEEEVA